MADLARFALEAMESGERWLTPQAKGPIVANWLESRRRPIPADAGGKGYPDPVIFRWTDTINAIPHACTLQSCAGHLTSWSDADGDHPFVYPGQLWIWLTETAARAAYEHLPRLASLPRIENTRILMSGGQEILHIIFEGAGRHEDFPLAPVVSWLAALA